jgi:hypothetical protein
MANSIFFRCPSCTARIKAHVTLLGRWRICPGCQRRFIVRDERNRRPLDAGPMLIADDRPSAPALAWR